MSAAQGVTRAYRPEVYQASLLQTWLDIAEHQDAKDRVLMPALARHFRPGRLLELGAGVGQLSTMIGQLGFEVVSSDYAQFFVDHMRTQGLDAHRVDATDISAADLGVFDNVFCQSITPFITTDYDIVAKSYRSAFAALRPGGHLVMIHAMVQRRRLMAGEMARHKELCEAAGFRAVHLTRQQLLPSRLYRQPFTVFAAALERALAPKFGHRFYLVATHP